MNNEHLEILKKILETLIEIKNSMCKDTAVNLYIDDKKIN